MTLAVFLAAASWIGLATPAFAQHAGHGAPSPSQSPAQATGDPSCPAGHAAMGHCTPKPAVPARPVVPNARAPDEPARRPRHATFALGPSGRGPPGGAYSDGRPSLPARARGHWPLHAEGAHLA